MKRNWVNNMNNRIRYEDVNGVMVSKNMYMHETNGAKYQVKLYPNELRYEVVDVAAGDKVAVEGTATTLNMLKKVAKGKLEVLGIPFVLEERQKRSVEVTEGSETLPSCEDVPTETVS